MCGQRFRQASRLFNRLVGGGETDKFGLRRRSLDQDAKQLLEEVEIAKRHLAAAASRYRNQLGREFIEVGPAIRHSRVEHAKMFGDRSGCLSLLRKGGRVVEIGTWAGSFAKEIWRACDPSELHIIDIDFSRFDRAFFEPHLGKRVFLHQGKSAELASTFDDGFFDFVYVDGDHSHHAARADIEQFLPKLATDGVMGVNDYTHWCAALGMPFGVARALHECIEELNLEVIAMGLERYGNHDLFVRRMK